MAKIIFDANTMILGCYELTDADGVFINGAAVKGWIEDEDGNGVWGSSASPKTLASLGAATPVTRNGVTHPDGNYEAVVEETTTWTPDGTGGFKFHKAFVTADDGVNRDGRWESWLRIQVRQFGQ